MVSGEGFQAALVLDAGASLVIAGRKGEPGLGKSANRPRLRIPRACSDAVLAVRTKRANSTAAATGTERMSSTTAIESAAVKSNASVRANEMRLSDIANPPPADHGSGR